MGTDVLLLHCRYFMTSSPWLATQPGRCASANSMQLVPCAASRQGDSRAPGNDTTKLHNVSVHEKR